MDYLNKENIDIAKLGELKNFFVPENYSLYGDVVQRKNDMKSIVYEIIRTATSVGEFPELKGTFVPYLEKLISDFPQSLDCIINVHLLRTIHLNVQNESIKKSISLRMFKLKS